MSENELVDREFIKALSRKRDTLDAELRETRQKAIDFTRRARQIGKVIERIDILRSRLLGNDAESKRPGKQPSGNARIAVLHCMASEPDKRWAPREIVEKVTTTWMHSESAVRSALERATERGEVQNPTRGVYLLEPREETA